MERLSPGLITAHAGEGGVGVMERKEVCAFLRDTLFEMER